MTKPSSAGTLSGQEPNPNSTLTPTIREFFVKNLFWFGTAALVIALALVTFFSQNALSIDSKLASASTKPSGGGALFEVLKQQGVDARSSDSFDETMRLLDEELSGPTTVLLYDSFGFLTDTQLAELKGRSTHLVVVEPSLATLEGLDLSVRHAGFSGEDPRNAECTLPLSRAAEVISGEGKSYRLGDSDAVGCYPREPGGDAYSLVQLQEGSTKISVTGAGDAFSNMVIPVHDNAAYALWLLGEHANLIWYIPGFSDAPAGDPGLAELTPSWVTPLVILAFTVALAASLWRGRRLGKLVVENLPVTVPANETVEGRARLYQRNASRQESLDALRIGTITRIAKQLGLSETSAMPEVISAAAVATGASPQSLGYLLLDAVPQNDEELVSLSDQLIETEHRVKRSVDPTLGAAENTQGENNEH